MWGKWYGKCGLKKGKKNDDLVRVKEGDQVAKGGKLIH